MKRFIYTIIITLLVLFAAIPLSASAEEEQIKYPESIAGYQVIFVKNHENTVGMVENNIILVLLDETPRFEKEKEPPSRLAIGKYLDENKMPQGWSIEVIGGPGLTKESFIKTHQQNQEQQRDFEKTTEIDLNDYSKGLKTFAIMQNKGPLYNTIDYIAATIHEAPVIGLSQNMWSFMMVNGKTNTNYFIQAGQKYGKYGDGTNIWTDTDMSLVPQPFSIPYYQGDTYEFEVGLNVSTWFVATSNLDNGNHDSVYRRSTGTGGTYFVNSTDTSIFFENANSNANWWSNFTNPIRVKWAAERRNGQYSYWLYESVVIKDSYGAIQPNNGKITGSLLNFGSAYWYLNNLLVVQ